MQAPVCCYSCFSNVVVVPMRLPSLICGGYFYDINYILLKCQLIFAFCFCMSENQNSCQTAVEQQLFAGKASGKLVPSAGCTSPGGEKKRRKLTRGCFNWPFSPKKLHTKELSTKFESTRKLPPTSSTSNAISRTKRTLHPTQHKPLPWLNRG